MIAGIIPIKQKGFWLTEISKQLPEIEFNQFTLRLEKERYKALLVSVGPRTELLQVKESIMKFPSIEYFSYEGEINGRSLHFLTIDDSKFPPNQVRSLIKLKEVIIYRFLPQIARRGIQHIHALFSDKIAFERSINVLDRMPDLSIVRENKNFGIWDPADNEIVFPSIFSLLGVKREDEILLRQLFQDACFSEGYKLKEKEGDAMKRIISIILEFPSMVELFSKPWQFK